MLFYYFNSKQELFEDLLLHGLSLILDEYLTRIDEQQTDFIEKYRQASIYKMKSYRNNPYAYEFFGKFYMTHNYKHLAPESVKKLEDTIAYGYEKLYRNIDTSLFRKDLPSEKVIKMIVWCMDGYEKELVEKLKDSDWAHLDVEPLLQQFYDLLELLKQTFYHQEG